MINVWPEWSIEKKIGQGAYGAVYKAVRREYGVENYAAIKVISIPLEESEIDELILEGYSMEETNHYFKQMVDDFVKEIQFMESLKGVQNVVSVEDYKVVEKTDEIGYEIFIRMELLTPLNDYLCDKRLEEEDVIKLGIDVCNALELCKRRNIIHRDVKPENIFVNEFGFYKLGDFGVAKKLDEATGALSKKGTYNYAAPEVLRGMDYDERADIYSLGIVLYRLLNNNRLPFLNPDKQLLSPAEKMQAVEKRLKGERIEKPKYGSDLLSQVVLKACEFMPERRYSSAREMKEALQELLKEQVCTENENMQLNVEQYFINFDGSQKTELSLTDVASSQNRKARREYSKNMIIFAIIGSIIGIEAVFLISHMSNLKNFIYKNEPVVEMTTVEIMEESSQEEVLPQIDENIKDESLLYLETQKEYELGILYLSKREYEQAARMLLSAFSNTSWMKWYFRTEKIENASYDSKEEYTYYTGYLAKKAVLCYEKEKNEDPVAVLYYVDNKNNLDYYQFRTLDATDSAEEIFIEVDVQGNIKSTICTADLWENETDSEQEEGK